MRLCVFARYLPLTLTLSLTLSLSLSACSGGESNDPAGCAGDGTCLVPGGTFAMGCDEATAGCTSSEAPRHDVDVPTFRIDRTEVTVAAYARCVDAGGCTVPQATTGLCTWGVAGREQHPVNCIDWTQARAYCAWTGGRLCTEAEWEKAARGMDGRTFPWGEDPLSCAYAIVFDRDDGCGEGTTAPVDSRPEGTSPYGLVDCLGNVAEWVEDWSHDGYAGAPVDGSAWVLPKGAGGRVFRGGDLHSYQKELRIWTRQWDVETTMGVGLGVRCCKTP